MKKPIFYLILFLVAFEMNAQTKIATSNYAKATSNHSQRKIVRDSADNVYVVFVDSTAQGTWIKGVKLNASNKQGTNAANIVQGNNPTLAISRSGEIHLIFESNDPLTKIKHISTTNFTTWSSEKVISDTLYSSKLPVADTDQSGNLNIFWIERKDSENCMLMYGRMKNDTLTLKKPIFNKKIINEMAIANHLQFFSDVLIFSVQFSTDSLLFLRSTNRMETFDTIYSAKGTQPCVSYNSYNGGDHVFEDSNIRILYLDPLSHLIEVESNVGFENDNQIKVKKLSDSPIDYICIDDLLPPIGYSFLFMQNEKLYHGFSYGPFWDFTTYLDTISDAPFSPSLAFKNFSPEYVDFIWMKKRGPLFDIYYKRDDKYHYIRNGIGDFETGKGFTISGYPNPFNDHLKIEITVDDAIKSGVPVIEIYNLRSQLVRTLKAAPASGNRYAFDWDGTNQKNERVALGNYLLLCTVGKTRTARKVIYTK